MNKMICLLVTSFVTVVSFLTYQADIIIDYFTRLDIPLSSDCVDFLNEIDQLGEDIYEFYDTITIDKKNEIDENTNRLLEEIEEYQDFFINASSEFEYLFIKQIALNIKQVTDVAYTFSHGGEINYRDVHMAENTLWTNALFGEDTKVALWAHNGHVANWEWYQSIGMHLKNELNDAYQIINFGFSFGSFTAMRQELNNYILGTNYIIRHPRFGSINYVCHYAQVDNFILRISDIQEGSYLDRWISEPQRFLDIGAVFNGNSYSYYYTHEFKEHCDVLINWDYTTASEMLHSNINLYNDITKIPEMYFNT